MIQNYILLFLRKSLIAYPFLLGALFLIVPQAGFSAAIERISLDMDPFPSRPTVSNDFFLDITKKGSCTGSFLQLSKSSIDLVKKEINVELKFVSIDDDGDPCHSRLLITNNFPNDEPYTVNVYDDGSFNEPLFFGSFNVTATPISVVSPIPTLSEWTLILMALIILSFATRSIQVSNKFTTNKED